MHNVGFGRVTNAMINEFAHWPPRGGVYSIERSANTEPKQAFRLGGFWLGLCRGSLLELPTTGVDSFTQVATLRFIGRWLLNVDNSVLLFRAFVPYPYHHSSSNIYILVVFGGTLPRTANIVYPGIALLVYPVTYH